jgi:hypothetical protein
VLREGLAEEELSGEEKEVVGVSAFWPADDVGVASPGGDLKLELEPLYTATSDISAWLPSIVLGELRLEFFASISVAADGKVDEEGDDRFADAFSGVSCAATVPTADTIDGGLAPRISGFSL